MGKSILNPYKVFHVNQWVTTEVVRTLYKRMSLSLHPDKKDGSSEKFEELKEAYDILTDSKRKEDRDRKLREQYQSLVLFKDLNTASNFFGVDPADAIIINDQPVGAFSYGSREHIFLNSDTKHKLEREVREKDFEYTEDDLRKRVESSKGLLPTHTCFGLINPIPLLVHGLQSVNTKQRSVNPLFGDLFRDIPDGEYSRIGMSAGLLYNIFSTKGVIPNRLKSWIQ